MLNPKRFPGTATAAKLPRNKHKNPGRKTWPSVRALIGLCALLAVAAATNEAHADDPFYKGRRLTLLINFAAGGPTDIEGRLFAKYLARHIEGQPNIIIQNVDGAGGIVGAKYLGEVAPR